MSNLARGATIITIIALAVAGTVVGFELGDADGDDTDTGNRYQVHIDFDATATSADTAEVQVLLREYDTSVELIIMESFPLQGSAIVETANVGFCTAIVAELEAKSYIRGASCEQWTPVGDDGDTPVSTDNAG